jgi:ketosteroid isomerase-like protein
MATTTPTANEVQIRAVITDRAAAMRDRDAERFVAHYAPHIVKFDLPPPLGTPGWKPATPRRCAPSSPATPAAQSATRSAT